ncbi:MAG: hypothetical protein ACYC4K_02280 [Thiobacillus sp.]
MGIFFGLGISATVERFNKAIEFAGKHIKLSNQVVDSTKVQESRLIKDTILLDIPNEVGDFDTVLVRRATDKLKDSSLAWAEYAKQQQEAYGVIPLMVLQVPNTPDPNEIGRALDTVFERYPELPAASVAHVFGDHTTQRFGNRNVPYIEPQRVQESDWVRVLIAKDAISTGWDCPRAEVMVSFRAGHLRFSVLCLPSCRESGAVNSNAYWRQSTRFYTPQIQFFHVITGGQIESKVWIPRLINRWRHPLSKWFTDTTQASLGAIFMAKV